MFYFAVIHVNVYSVILDGFSGYKVLKIINFSSESLVAHCSLIDACIRAVGLVYSCLSSR